MKLSDAGRSLALAVLLAIACDNGSTVVNRPPLPPRIVGPDTVMSGQPAEFEVEVYDPDGGRLVVFVAWGDGDTIDYGDFVYSGQVVVFRHAFAAGRYSVRGRCYDTEPRFSDWSAGHVVVSVPGVRRP